MPDAVTWSVFVATLPGFLSSFVITLVTLYLSYRNSKKVEEVKKEVQQELTKFSRWHDKRVQALEVIYIGFGKYLDFLRRHLYMPGSREPLDPMHEFHNLIVYQSLYLDESTLIKVQTYQGELLSFWNAAVLSLATEGEAARAHIQYRLDYEIPTYLRRLRKDINEYVDPYF